MSSNYLEIIRPGINTTFQDKGRDHLYHIGIPFSGAMDNRNYLLANKLVGNQLEFPVFDAVARRERAEAEKLLNGPRQMVASKIPSQFSFSDSDGS